MIYHCYARNYKSIDRITSITNRGLISFAYPEIYRMVVKWLERYDLVLDSLMLDSGAFTVFTQSGKQIDLSAYVDWIQEVEEYPRIKHSVAINLDHLTADDTHAGFEEGARLSYENWELLSSRVKTKVLPVFHSGEDPKWLRLILEETDDLALGGVATVRAGQKRRDWFKQIFTEHMPKGTKVHGLGVTSFLEMKTFPWTTVDSSSAVMDASMGGVLLPARMLQPYNQPDAPKWDYSRRTRLYWHGNASAGVIGSNRKKMALRTGFFEDLPDYRKGKNEFNMATQTPEYRELISEYLEEFGMVYDDMAVVKHRIYLNITFLERFWELHCKGTDELKRGQDTGGFDFEV